MEDTKVAFDKWWLGHEGFFEGRYQISQAAYDAGRASVEAELAEKQYVIDTQLCILKKVRAFLEPHSGDTADQIAERASEQIATLRNAVHRNYLDSPAMQTFAEMKHSKCGDLLRMLQDGDISCGKACEVLAELAHGVLFDEIPLPDIKTENAFGYEEIPAEVVAALRKANQGMREALVHGRDEVANPDFDRFGRQLPVDVDRLAIIDMALTRANERVAFLENEVHEWEESDAASIAVGDFLTENNTFKELLREAAFQLGCSCQNPHGRTVVVCNSCLLGNRIDKALALHGQPQEKS